MGDFVNNFYAYFSRNVKLTDTGIINFFAIHFVARNKKIISGRFSLVLQYEIQICEIIFYSWACFMLYFYIMFISFR